MFGLISNRNMPRQVLLFRQHPGHRMYYVEIRGYRWCIGVTIYTRQVESDSWWHTQPKLVSSILLVSEIINSTQSVTNLLVHGHMCTSIRGTVTLYSLVSFALTCHKGLDYTLIIFYMHRHNLLVSLWRICIVLSTNIVCSFVLSPLGTRQMMLYSAARGVPATNGRRLWQYWPQYSEWHALTDAISRRVISGGELFIITHVQQKESNPILKNLYHVKNIQHAFKIVTKLDMKCTPSVDYRIYQLLTSIIIGK